MCSSLCQRQFCTIMKGGADQLCSLSSVLLFTVPEAVSCLKKVRSIPSAGLSLRRELCLPDVCTSDADPVCVVDVQGMQCV